MMGFFEDAVEPGEDDRQPQVGRIYDLGDGQYIQAIALMLDPRSEAVQMVADTTSEGMNNAQEMVNLIVAQTCLGNHGSEAHAPHTILVYDLSVMDQVELILN